MSDPVFKAKVAPVLEPQAQRLVDIYNNTYGSCAPGCNPAGLASVLSEVLNIRDEIPFASTQALLSSLIEQLQAK
jgi:hypothetical protein